MITFLDTLVLGALALAAVPVLIHLLNRKKARVIIFSSLTFLKSLQNKKIRRVRLQQWILLLLRTLVVIFLVLAFARPVSTLLRSDDLATHGNTSLILIVDNSLIGTALSQNGAGLDRAKRMALEIVGHLKEGDEFHVMTTDAPAAVLEFSSNVADAEAAVGGISPMFNRPFLLESIFQAGELMKSARNPNKEICVISPLQDKFIAEDKISIPHDISIAFIRFSPASFQNVALTKSRITSRLFEPGKPLDLRIGLRNDGSNAVTVPVSVFSGDRRVAQAPLAIDAGEEKESVIRFILPETPSIQGRVEIEDDAVLADNVRFFNVSIPDTISALIAGDATDTDLIALALHPGEDAKSRIRILRVRADKMAMADAADVDVVICSNVELKDTEMSLLERVLEKGRSVIFFPGNRTNAEKVNSVFARWQIGVLSPLVNADASKDRVVMFDRVDMAHPIVSGLFDDPAKKTSIESPSIFRVLGHRVGPASSTVIGLSTGDGFLTESRVKAGKFLFFASAPVLSWSDFPARGLFAPLLVRSVYYLTTPDQALEDGTGDYFLVARHDVGGGILLSGGGESLAPTTRSTKSGLIVQRPSNMRPGNYDVLTDGGKIGIISANLFPELTNPIQVSDDRLKTVIGRQDLEIVEENGNISDVVFRSRFGVELWNGFMLTALILLLSELLISQWTRLTGKTELAIQR